MVKPIVISSIGVVSAGAIAAGVMFANQSDSYSSYLEKNGRKLLEEGATEWSILKTKYNAENEGLQITLKNQNTPLSVISEEQLKIGCKENAENKFLNKEDKTFLTVSAGCTTPKTIKEQIGTSKIILNVAKGTGGATNEHSSLGTEKEAAYKRATNTNLIKEVQGNKESTDVKIGAVTVDKLKDGCNLSKEKHFKHDKDERYLKFLEWCVN